MLLQAESIYHDCADHNKQVLPLASLSFVCSRITDPGSLNCSLYYLCNLTWKQTTEKSEVLRHKSFGKVKLGQHVCFAVFLILYLSIKVQITAQTAHPVVPAFSPIAFGTLAQYIMQDWGLWVFVSSLRHACTVTKQQHSSLSRSCWLNLAVFPELIIRDYLGKFAFRTLLYLEKRKPMLCIP